MSVCPQGLSGATLEVATAPMTECPYCRAEAGCDGVEYRYDDGGRSATRKGTAGDCAVRSLRLATGGSYEDLYRDVADSRYAWATSGRTSADKRRAIKQGRTASKGVATKLFTEIAERHGWVWRTLAEIGRPSPVRVANDHLPIGLPLMLNLSGHITFWDGLAVCDTHDPSRWTYEGETYQGWEGVPSGLRALVRPTRMVYGVWHRRRQVGRVERWATAARLRS